jgi:UDPglucose 6-dehydrogenase
MLLIAGYGFVGKAIHAQFVAKMEIGIIDPIISDRTVDHYDHEDIDGVIIAVSTPPKEDGSCDGSNVKAVISNTHKSVPIMIKSALSLEAWREIKTEFPEHRVGFSPEFLRGDHAVADFASEKFQVFGSDDQGVLGTFRTIFQTGFPDTNMEFRFCSAEEAIIVKYAENSFLAMKVGFFNHLHEIAQKTGVDFETIRYCLTVDPRINPDHSFVPGPTGDFGWGGHCLPKDTSAFLKTAEYLDYDFTILKAVVEYNDRQQKQNMLRKKHVPKKIVTCHPADIAFSPKND